MRRLIFRDTARLCGIDGVYAQGSSDPGVESKTVALERVWKLQACKAKDLNTLDEILDNAFAVDVFRSSLPCLRRTRGNL